MYDDVPSHSKKIPHQTWLLKTKQLKVLSDTNRLSSLPWDPWDTTWPYSGWTSWTSLPLKHTKNNITACQRGQMKKTFLFPKTLYFSCSRSFSPHTHQSSKNMLLSFISFCRVSLTYSTITRLCEAGHILILYFNLCQNRIFASKMYK